jgi:hypothetical protein
MQLPPERRHLVPREVAVDVPLELLPQKAKSLDNLAKPQSTSPRNVYEARFCKA